MNELISMNFNGIDVIDSRQVAEAIRKDHHKLLRDIRIYGEYLTQPKIGLSDFFIESTYTDPTGRTLPCYLCTRKGCEMIANKLTGKKGVVFTALYINAFHKMEKQYKQQNYCFSIDTTDIVMAIKELYEKNCELNDKIYSLNKENYELNYKIDQLNHQINRLNKENREFTAIIKILCEKVLKINERKQSRKSKSKKRKLI